MSLGLRIILFLGLTLTGCSQSYLRESYSKQAELGFSYQEVISTLNLLVAIIDWPKETIEYQKKFNITPDLAQELILPLHPLWDEKIKEFAKNIGQKNSQEMGDFAKECSRDCRCEFYLALLEAHPELEQKAPVEFKKLSNMKYSKKKSDILSCLNIMPPISKLIEFLHSEKKKYQSDSAY